MSVIGDTRTYLEKLRHIFVKYRPVLIVAAVGLILMLWPSHRNEETKEAVRENSAATDLLSNTTDMEQRMQTVLTQVEGVGRVEVMLTLSRDMEILYAEEVSKTREASGTMDAVTETYQLESVDYVALRNSDGGESLIPRTRLYPVYQGALIVCDGADQAGIRLKVINAVSALTGLSSDCITVMKMK